MGALTLSDLQVLDAQPRVRDLTLAEGLGFGRVRDVRKLIERSISELQSFGVCATVAQTPSPRGGRPTVEYWLNEPQALLICMFARTPKAAEMRRQIVEVFLAWRHGQTSQLAPVPPVRIESRFEVQARQLAGVRAIIAFDAETEISAFALSLPQLLAQGRRASFPRFFHDLPVREYAIRLQDQVPVAMAVEIIAERFGPGRTPTRSALHRFWQRLRPIRQARGALT